MPPAVVAEWWMPFAEFLVKERRYSPYTLRNYRQAFEDFDVVVAEIGFDRLELALVAVVGPELIDARLSQCACGEQRE